MSTPNRPPRPTHTLTVQRTERLSPQMVRVVVGGEGFEAFVDNGFSDKYVKLIFGDVRRTYTVRWVDEGAREFALDFVLHGDEGIAGPWANRAQPGDPVTFSGPGGAYSPNPDADWHLFVGDAAALPAIAAGLEALLAAQPDARGVAHLLVEGESERISLRAPAGVSMHWHYTDNIGAHPSLLAEAVASGAWLDGRVHVFAHGEREAMKALRALFKEREIAREDLSLSGYWAYGRTEDVFQAEKKEPIGKID